MSVQVTFEELDGLLLAETNRLGIVIAQPRLELYKDTNPPFRIADSSREEALQYVKQSLQAADELATESRLVILPEYSVAYENPGALQEILN